MPSGLVNGNGGTDSRATFIVHKVEKNKVKLQSAANPKHFLRVDPKSKQLNGLGSGGTYTVFHVIKHSDFTVSFRNAKFPKMYIGILPDGSAKAPAKTGTGPHGRFLVLKKEEIEKKPPTCLDKPLPSPPQSETKKKPVEKEENEGQTGKFWSINLGGKITEYIGGFSSNVGPVIPVDPSKEKLLVSVMAKTSSSDLKTQSRCYFGVDCLDENKEHIPVHYNYRLEGTECTVMSYNQDSLELKVKGNLSLWPDPNTCINGWTSIGFYDYDTDIPPFYVVTRGSYSEKGDGVYGALEEDTIKLKIPLPEEVVAKIVPGKTKILSHRSTSAYNYCAAGGLYVPFTWTAYKGEIKGPASFGGANGIFRKGTKYVKFLVLASYHQGNAGVSVLLKDVQITKIPNDD